MTVLQKDKKDSLPIGWKKSKLGDVAIYFNGRAFKPTEWKNEGIPIIRIQNLNNPDATYNYSDGIYEERFKVRNGDLLFAWSASLGAYIWNGEDAWLNQHIFKVVPKESTDKQYLYYLLDKVVHELYAKAHGSGMVHVTKGKFESTEIPFPPLNVQKQIVVKLEELFSELDKSVEELKKTQQQLKVYRQALLNSCVKNAELKTINSIIQKLDQGWSPKCYNEASNDVNEWAVIKTTAVQAGFFLEKENKILPNHLEPRRHHELKSGDILITRAGPRVRVGVCCLVKHTRPKLINCDKVYRIKINSEVALPEYIEILLNSPTYSKEIEKMKTGINDSGVNLTQKGFTNILIPLPTLKEQQRIVREIESGLSVYDKMEETINDSLKQAEALRQSILKKAFEGVLV